MSNPTDNIRSHNPVSIRFSQAHDLGLPAWPCSTFPKPQRRCTLTAILCTTTYAPSPEDPRFLQALKTCDEARDQHLRLICVDGSPEAIAPEIRSLLEVHGAWVFSQKERGMGASRRETLRHALAISTNDVIVWLEPEKYPIVSLLQPAIDMVRYGGYDLVVPRRRNLDGYPVYQQLSELRANWELGDITGRHDLDLMIGPRVFSRRAATLFESYVGATPETDRWEILFIPVLWAIHHGMKTGSCLVNYVHPPEQTAAEEGDAEMDRKRDVQRINLIASMLTVAEQLKRSGEKIKI